MTRKYWLLSAIATAAAVTTSVSAQEADAGAELEEIVVTGSYLFTGLDSPSPVVVITGDEIVTSAPTDLATYFFDNVPQNNARDPVVFTTADGQLRIRSLRTALSTSEDWGRRIRWSCSTDGARSRTQHSI